MADPVLKLASAGMESDMADQSLRLASGLRELT